MLLSCEHGGCRIPPRFHGRFSAPWQSAWLASHCGWDAGALAAARYLSRELSAPLLSCETSRLLVDLNRSERNPAVFSKVSRTFPAAEREWLLRNLQRPHWAAVAAAIATGVGRGGATVHLSVHSFTPVYHDYRRRVDVGLLYDPRRPAETALCQLWQRRLQSLFPELNVWRNHPYRGWTDGVVTGMRRKFAPTAYLGIELELNQRLLTAAGVFPRRLLRALAHTLPAAEAAEQ